MNNLQQILHNVGLIPGRKIGKYHRCGTIKSPRSLNGWYIPNEYGVIYGDWANSDKNGFVSYNGSTPTRNEWDKIKLERMRIEKEIDLFKMEEIRASYAKMDKLTIKTPYMGKKQINICGDVKQNGNGFAVGMYNEWNELMGYQTIYDNWKHTEEGSKVSGHFFPLCEHKGAELVILAEGYATACSIFMALNEYWDARNFSILCCFGAGNIDKVSEALFNINIIAIKDNDIAGIKVKTKGFTVGDGDANDVHCAYGIDELTKRIINGLEGLK